MTEVKGIAASGGYAVSKAYVFRHDVQNVLHETVSEDQVGSELERLSDAFSSVKSYVSSLLSSSVGDSERELYSVELLMLDDPEYRKMIESLVQNSFHTAEWAVESATKVFVDALGKLSDEYMRERSNDIKDIEHFLLESLQGKKRSEIRLERDSILVADYILTSEFMSIINPGYIKGVVIDTGGRTSHVALLAKSKGIPAVVGCQTLSSDVSADDTIAVDGYKGVVVVNPSRKVSYEIMDLKIKESENEKKLSETMKGPSVTKDGKRILLKTNIEGLDGIGPTLSAHADGVGLFRTEFLVLENGFDPDDDKSQVYIDSAEKMAGVGDVTFRTLDVGGDKIFKDQPFEANQFMGFRAIRVSLQCKDIFKKQIKRILKASKWRNARIMFPLISSEEELDEALGVLEDAKEELSRKNIPFDEKLPVGTMIEVPSAAIMIDRISRKVDFVSVGTNDLVQYTLAVDRGNEKVGYLYRPMHPAVLRLLKMIVDGAHESERSVSICGEMAGDLKYLPLLVGLGFDELSVSPPLVLSLRAYLRELDSRDCRTLSNEILSIPGYTEIERRLKEIQDARRTGDKEQG